MIDLKREIRFAKPDVGGLETSNIERVIRSGWLTTGPNVARFEKKVAELSGTESAVAVDSCTSALELTLRLLGVGPGDEVITTPLTYTATADVIHAVGAKIVFCDLKDHGFEMDYSKLDQLITEKTKAIICVDYGGKICDYDRVLEEVEFEKPIFKPNSWLQEELGRIAVIADAAHSFTASKEGHPSGSFADFTCFSFHVLKNITTCGEGGAIVWKGFNSDTSTLIRDILCGYRHHFQTGKDPVNGWEYDILDFGYNRPMTDIDAAMGLAQLERLDRITQKRREITRNYDHLFDSYVKYPTAEPGIWHYGPNYETAMHLYPVLFDTTGWEDGSDEIRNRISIKLREQGIQTNVHYKPLPMFTAYQKLGYDIKDYPNAYQRFRQMLTIPYHTFLTIEDQVRVVEAIGKAVRDL